jgi:hypothetical protein
LWLQLRLNQLKIPSPLPQQLLVASSLHDAATFNHMDNIGVLDSAEAMRDGDGRSAGRRLTSAIYPCHGAGTHLPLLAFSSAICTAFSDSASNALVASARHGIQCAF